MLVELVFMALRRSLPPTEAFYVCRFCGINFVNFVDVNISSRLYSYLAASRRTKSCRKNRHLTMVIIRLVTISRRDLFELHYIP